MTLRSKLGLEPFVHTSWAKDSILGLTDSKEFVVYDSAQVYPEYVMRPQWCFQRSRGGRYYQEGA